MDTNNNQTSKVALLVIDMQAAFLRVIPNNETLLVRTRFAIAAARLFGIEVYFTEQVPEKLGGTEAALLEAAPCAPVFGKTAFSSLGAEGLTDLLKEKGIEHLLLTGIETPICVYQTARDALAMDFDVTLLSDCIGCRRADDIPHVYSTLRAAGAHVLPGETIFYSLLGGAQHPLFREFTALVKQAG